MNGCQKWIECSLNGKMKKMEIFKLVQDTNVFFFVMYLASGSSHVQL